MSAQAEQAAEALVLDDGRRVCLRSIRPDDRAGLLALFERLSPESRRRRFLTSKPELNARELIYLTEVDHVDHEAIVAIDQRDGSIVGVARYAGYDDPGGPAEFAIAVADELHNMGIGTALAKRVVGRARCNGLAVLTASTLWENRPARALLKRLQFRPLSSAGALIEYRLLLEPRVTQPPVSRAAAS